MPSTFEREAQDNKTRHDKRRAQPDNRQPELWLESPLIPPRHDVCDIVMEPMTHDLTNGSGNKRRKVEKSNLLGTEAIKRRDQHGQGRVDTDGPGKRKDIVETDQSDDRAGNDLDGAHDGFLEGAALMTGLPLLGADETEKTAASLGLLGAWYLAVVESLICKEKLGDERNAGQDGEDAKGPLPFLGVDDKGREKGTKVGTEEDKANLRRV